MRLLPSLLALCLGASSAFADSLWLNTTNNEQGMFADKRARNIGDILTVVAQENYTTTQAQEIKTYDKTENAFGPILNNIINQFLNQVPALITATTGVKAASSGSGSGGNKHAMGSRTNLPVRAGAVAVVSPPVFVHVVGDSRVKRRSRHLFVVAVSAIG